jgi:alpha-beta hydrolase superfamily lysophospholipase
MAMVIAHKMPELTNGVVLVSPVYGPRVWVSARFLANGAYIATHPRKGMLDMSPYLKDRLSPNPELSLQQVEDPMSRDKQTAKELAQSMALNFSGKKQSRMITAPTAVLVMHGKEDRLCNPHTTAKEFEKIPSANKQLALIDGVGHLAVESSEIDPKVFSTLSTWIDAQDKSIAAR